MSEKEQHVAEGIERAVVSVSSLRTMVPSIAAAGELMAATLRAGGCVLTAGNGGSAAEAMHMAEELSGRYKHNRKSLAGISLVADGTALTCIANDFGFEHVFSRQIEGLGKDGDLLVLFSTSGSGRNLELAVEAAHESGMKLLLLLGRDGGALKGRGDIELIVPGDRTEHIQEAHQVILHQLLEIVEVAILADQGEEE